MKELLIALLITLTACGSKLKVDFSEIKEVETGIVEITHEDKMHFTVTPDGNQPWKSRTYSYVMGGKAYKIFDARVYPEKERVSDSQYVALWETASGHYFFAIPGTPEVRIKEVYAKSKTRCILKLVLLCAVIVGGIVAVNKCQ